MLLNVTVHRVLFIVGEASVDLINLISSLISFNTSNGLFLKYLTKSLFGSWVIFSFVHISVLHGSNPSFCHILIFPSSESLAMLKIP